MKLIILTLLSFLMLQSFIFGQTAKVWTSETAALQPVDTLKKVTSEKRPFAAALGIFGTNLIINRYDANIRHVKWAEVTPKVWSTNLKTGFHTDYDHFTTNWIGHPMHGAYFYNAARVNGYNYWQSIPFTVGGSLMWEYFGETYPASEIDLFTTSFGGIYLGEMTHRLTDVFRRKIKNKFLKQTTITLLNPMSQLNGLFLKNNSLPYDSISRPLVTGQLTVGGSYPWGEIKENILGTRLYLNLSLTYGDLFEQTKKSYKPFDFFVFKTWGSFTHSGKDTIYLNIVSHAPLFVKRFNKHSVISLSQHYNYLASDIYKIGSLAVTGDYSVQSSWGEKNDIMGSVKAGYIIFGSSKSNIVKYIHPTDDPEFPRDYVYGNGWTAEAELSIKTKKYGRLVANIDQWVIYTKRDAKGTENITLLIAEYYMPVSQKLSVGTQFNYYKRTAHYKDYPDFSTVNKDYYEVKALAAFNF